MICWIEKWLILFHQCWIIVIINKNFISKLNLFKEFQLLSFINWFCFISLFDIHCYRSKYRLFLDREGFSFEQEIYLFNGSLTVLQQGLTCRSIFSYKNVIKFPFWWNPVIFLVEVFLFQVKGGFVSLETFFYITKNCSFQLRPALFLKLICL